MASLRADVIVPDPRIEDSLLTIISHIVSRPFHLDDFSLPLTSSSATPPNLLLSP